jgi:hypothetical protein
MSLSLPSFSQDTNFVEIDSLYKEDQFYVGITYNLLGKIADSVSQSGFSSGFHIGFIKDIPINKRRNLAIGIGLGYSANSFNQNLLIGKDSQKEVTYSILTGSDDFTKNKFALHFLELPLEFRWRSSTLSDYKFWRIYTGFKFSYLITHTTKYNGSPNDQEYSDIDHFNDFQYGISTSIGYNTWNIHLYYGLNTIFNNRAILNGKPMEMNAIRIGLMFYLL